MKRIKVIGDALMWSEPPPPGQRRGLHRGEFKGWIGEVPDEVAEAAIAARQAIEATDDMLDTGTADELATPSFDAGIIHTRPMAEVLAYLAQIPASQQAGEALRISELELQRAKPRHQLIVQLDKIVENATA